MAEVDMIKAREVYHTLLKMLDSINWTYDRNDEKLLIKSGVRGDDLPVDFVMLVRPQNQVIQFISSLPFKISEDKRVEAAVAVCVANYNLVHGSFDYDIRDGEISFRLTSSYRDSKIGEEMLKYMVMVAASTTDSYNDKFFMLSKGALTVQEFIKQENAK